MIIGMSRKNHTRREARMIGSVRIEAGFQTDRVMLQISFNGKEYGNKRRLFIHPVRCIHNQGTLRRGNVNASSTLFLHQSTMHFNSFTYRATFRSVLLSMSLEYPRRQKAWSIPGRPPPSTRSIAGESDFNVVKSMSVSLTGMGVSFGIWCWEE